MRLSSLVYLCLSITASLAAPEGEPNTGEAVNWSSLRQAIETMSFTNNPLPIPTKTANLNNIPAPPPSLIPQIISAVPPTVIVDLVNPARRSSLASDFKAGNTPTWYGSLPTDVKSYLSVVKKEIGNGALTATTGLAYQTEATAADATATPTSTSTSEGVAPAGPKPTGGLGVSALGALGVVGAALVL